MYRPPMFGHDYRKIHLLAASCASLLYIHTTSTWRAVNWGPKVQRFSFPSTFKENTSGAWLGVNTLLRQITLPTPWLTLRRRTRGGLPPLQTFHGSRDAFGRLLYVLPRFLLLAHSSHRTALPQPCRQSSANRAPFSFGPVRACTCGSNPTLEMSLAMELQEELCISVKALIVSCGSLDHQLLYSGQSSSFK